MLDIRLSSHLLNQYYYTTPLDVVRHYGALQAQDIGQATWVIGSRIENSTEEMVRNACRDGSIVRTWPMRGTLHYMDPRNVKWMLSLCAVKTLPGFAKRREYLGITDVHAEKALEIMDRELRGGKFLTRTELGKTLEMNGIPMQTQWTYHLACYAATRGLICFGPPTEKEETFVLLDEWVKNSINLNQDEQLAELARMYFRGHSPASIDDLAWWCGLGKTDCRKAENLIENELEKLEYNGKEYYSFLVPVIASKMQGSVVIQSSRHSEACTELVSSMISESFDTKNKEDAETSSAGRKIHFIGGFDEYFLGYKDRSIVADIEHYGKLFTTNGIFFPLILQNGRVIGSWKREFKKDSIIFRIEILPGFSYDKNELEKQCLRYTEFSGYKKYILQ